MCCSSIQTGGASMPSVNSTQGWVTMINLLACGSIAAGVLIRYQGWPWDSRGCWRGHRMCFCKQSIHGWQSSTRESDLVGGGWGGWVGVDSTCCVYLIRHGVYVGMGVCIELRLRAVCNSTLHQLHIMCCVCNTSPSPPPPPDTRPTNTTQMFKKESSHYGINSTCQPPVNSVNGETWLTMR